MNYSLEPAWSPASADELYVAARLAPKPEGFEETMNRIRANDPQLRRLDLNGRGLSSWNAIELCDALTTNTTLTSLNVSHNEIGAAGAQALATNTTLTSLNVSQNRIGAAGARALAANTTLTSLDASWNQIAPANRLLLTNAITRNIIEAKKTILRLHAFASIANNYPLSPQFLPGDMVWLVCSFLTTKKECLIDIRERAAERSSRHLFFQPVGTGDLTIEPVESAAIPANKKRRIE